LFQSLGSIYRPSLAYSLTLPLGQFEPTTIDSDNQPFGTVKEAIKAHVDLLLKQFVFEPNNYATWLQINHGVDHYLYQLWEAGELIGKTSQEAYRVNVGLGSTMTAEDILQGTLIVAITLFLKGEEDFLELTFRMQVAV
jgi:phage tail sheath protein FI